MDGLLVGDQVPLARDAEARVGVFDADELLHLLLVGLDVLVELV